MYAKCNKGFFGLWEKGCAGMFFGVRAVYMEGRVIRNILKLQLV